jgi:FAD/FMN-containing dehydrogenase
MRGRGHSLSGQAQVSPVEWQEHDGPEVWSRLSAANKRFDPDNVLTPGAGIC